MANLPVKKDDGVTTVYLKGSGAGTDVDPFILDRTDTALSTKVGEVQANPTSNTLLARIKDLLTGIVLAAGTNAIGKLAANSGVDIGDVDVTSIAPGTNLIGKVGIDQVSANANEVVVKTINTGSNAIGKLAANSGVDIGDVDVTSIAAGTNLIGKVSIDQVTANANEVVVKNGGGKSISVTPTITAGAYSAKDAVGGMMTFANAARVSGGHGVINSLTIVDKDDEKAQLELWVFNADPSGVADNAPMDFADADMAKLVGIIPISTADYYSLLDNGAACIRGVLLQFDCAATSLFAQLKCVGTPTYTGTSDLIVTLGIEYLD